MKVLFFSDADKDDLYSLTLLVAQCYYKNIDILGVICDNGFLDHPLNLSITDFWLNKVLNYNKIQLYAGIQRSSYLVQQRYFPETFITSYLDEMKKTFNYSTDYVPTNFKNINKLIKVIKAQKNKSIYILTTGNVTSFSYLLDKCKCFAKKINKIVSMGGNYQVKGNVIPSDIKLPNIVPDSEYNLYLDPDAFQNIINSVSKKLYICPLDCTNYAPLTKKTISTLETIGSKYLKKENDRFIINLYNQFIKLLKTTLATINTTLYMWDLVATLLFLNKNIKQKKISENIEISWTGKIIDRGYGISNKCHIYNFIDYDMFLRQIIYTLFNV